MLPKYIQNSIIEKFNLSNEMGKLLQQYVLSIFKTATKEERERFSDACATVAYNLDSFLNIPLSMKHNFIKICDEKLIVPGGPVFSFASSLIDSLNLEFIGPGKSVKTSYQNALAKRLPPKIDQRIVGKFAEAIITLCNLTKQKVEVAKQLVSGEDQNFVALLVKRINAGISTELNATLGDIYLFVGTLFLEMSSANVFGYDANDNNDSVVRFRYLGAWCLSHAIVHYKSEKKPAKLISQLVEKTAEVALMGKCSGVITFDILKLQEEYLADIVRKIPRSKVGHLS